MQLRALPFLYNITLYCGATYRQGFRWLPGDTPADLTGFGARMQIRAMLDRQRIDTSPAGLLLDLSNTTTGITLGGVLGTITLLIDAEATAALPPETPSRYDLELVDPGGDVIRWAMGRVSISPEVSLP